MSADSNKTGPTDPPNAEAPFSAGQSAADEQMCPRCGRLQPSDLAKCQSCAIDISAYRAADESLRAVRRMLEQRNFDGAIKAAKRGERGTYLRTEFARLRKTATNRRKRIADYAAAARQAFAADDYEGAMDQLGRALRLAPQSPDLLQLAGEIEAQREAREAAQLVLEAERHLDRRNFRAAEECCNALAEREPSHPMLATLRARGRELENEYQTLLAKATQEYQARHFEAALEQISALAQRYEWDHLLRRKRDHWQMRSDQAESVRQQALDAMAARQWSAAIQIWRKFLAACPDDTQAAAQLAECERQQLLNSPSRRRRRAMVAMLTACVVVGSFATGAYVTRDRWYRPEPAAIDAATATVRRMETALEEAQYADVHRLADEASSLLRQVDAEDRSRAAELADVVLQSRLEAHRRYAGSLISNNAAFDEDVFKQARAELEAGIILLKASGQRVPDAGWIAPLVAYAHRCARHEAFSQADDVLLHAGNLQGQAAQFDDLRRQIRELAKLRSLADRELRSATEKVEDAQKQHADMSADTPTIAQRPEWLLIGGTSQLAASSLRSARESMWRPSATGAGRDADEALVLQREAYDKTRRLAQLASQWAERSRELRIEVAGLDDAISVARAQSSAAAVKVDGPVEDAEARTQLQLAGLIASVGMAQEVVDLESDAAASWQAVVQAFGFARQSGLERERRVDAQRLELTEAIQRLQEEIDLTYGPGQPLTELAGEHWRELRRRVAAAESAWTGQRDEAGAVAGFHRAMEMLPMIKADLAAAKREQLLRSGGMNTVGMPLVRCQGGSFMMGSPSAREGREEEGRNNADDSERRRLVKIERDFLIGRFEVTVGQYLRFAQATDRPVPDAIMRMKADRPVTHVSWSDANAFCQWLSEREGIDYRLPTEAQWEYACRAGTRGAFYWGDDRDEAVIKACNFGGRFDPLPVDLALALPHPRVNPWGICDMHGNVSEWCAGQYLDTPTRPVRGGSYETPWQRARAAARRGWPGDEPQADIGFRVVVEVDPVTTLGVAP